MRCPHPDHQRREFGYFELQVHVLEHLIALEALMTESNAQQAQLDSDVAQIGTNVATIVQELKDQISANPEQPAAALDLSKLDALVASTSAEAAADAPAAPPAAPPADTSTPPADAGTSTPPATTAPAQPDRPVYVHATGDPIDATAWPTAPFTTDAGQQLYYFANDVPGGTATGASALWNQYTGAVTPTS